MFLLASLCMFSVILRWKQLDIFWSPLSCNTVNPEVIFDHDMSLNM